MEIKNGDLVGIPPSGFIAKLVCKILHAQTFHWGMVIGKDKDGYIVSESLGKGTSITRFRYPNAYIYRIKGLKHTPDMYRLISYHSWFGNMPYDMQVNFLSALWFILKHYLKIVIPVIKNHTFNCQEWICYLADCLRVKIIPDDQYPYCINIEKSDKLEYIGEWNGKECTRPVGDTISCNCVPDLVGVGGIPDNPCTRRDVSSNPAIGDNDNPVLLPQGKQ